MDPLEAQYAHPRGHGQYGRLRARRRVRKIYDFIWDTYCDWFIELTKNRLNSDDQTTRENAQNVLCYVLIETLKLLHPFMPFITEEIWQALPHEGEFLMLSKWPEYNEKFSFPAEEEAMQTVIEAITAIRARRNEMNVAPSKKVHYTVATAHADTFSAGIPFFTRLASASDVTIVPADCRHRRRRQGRGRHPRRAYLHAARRTRRL